MERKKERAAPSSASDLKRTAPQSQANNTACPLLRQGCGGRGSDKTVGGSMPITDPDLKIPPSRQTVVFREITEFGNLIGIEMSTLFAYLKNGPISLNCCEGLLQIDNPFWLVDALNRVGTKHGFMIRFDPNSSTFILNYAKELKIQAKYQQPHNQRPELHPELNHE